jgi:hypothetical protein
MLIKYFKDSESLNGQISYSIWIGDEVTEYRSIFLKPENEKFFIDIMNVAAKIDSNFEFEATESVQYGKFIVKIGDHSQDISLNKFWMLYILPSFPDIKNKPRKELLSNKGVSTLEVENQKHYLFWLKTVDI